MNDDIARQLGPQLDRIYSPRTPDPIGYVQSDFGGTGVRYPVYGYLFADRDEQGREPAGAFCVIGHYFLTADGETFVELRRIGQDYPSTGLCNVIHVEMWYDLLKFQHELNAVERIARAWLALHDIRQDERITLAAA